MKFFNLTKKWQNHVWKERYGCVSKVIEEERVKLKVKEKRTNKSIGNVWRICKDHKIEMEADSETVIESDIESEDEDDVHGVKVVHDVHNEEKGDNSCRKLREFDEFKIVSQNVKGLKDDSKLEGIIDLMIVNKIDAFLL